MNMPTWLRRHLEATGDAGPDTVTRRVRGKACKQCGRFTLVGLDADHAAGPATVDPHPLSALGEALALLDARPTYALIQTVDHLELDGPRYAENITAGPAGSRPCDIVAEHRCTPNHLPTIPSAHAAPQPQGCADEPPF